MNESIYKYMKIGLISFMAYPEIMGGVGRIREVIEKIVCDSYFNALEITWIKDKHERNKVRELLNSSGMTVKYGAQPRLLTTGMNINDLDEEKRKMAVALLKEGIDEAYEMGATGFAFLSGKYNEAAKREAFESLIRSTSELCEYAETKGNMKIALEVFDYDVDKKSLIGPAKLAKEYAERITKDFGNFGLLVDLSHMPLLHESVEQSVIPVKDYIIHAHMGNCVVKDPTYPAFGDAHPRFNFPGSEIGAAGLANYLKVLMDIGFLNAQNPPVVSFEVKPYGNEVPEVVIANAKRTLNEAWAML